MRDAGGLHRSRGHLMLGSAGAGGGGLHCSRDHLMLAIAGSLLALVMVMVKRSTATALVNCTLYAMAFSCSSAASIKIHA